MKSMLILTILCSMSLAPVAFGFRLPPKEVPPVEHDGVQYVVVHSRVVKGATQKGGFIVARNKKSKKKIWDLQLYKTRYIWFLERDVQDVFIESMKLDATRKRLVLKDERNRVYHVDIATRKAVPAGKKKKRRRRNESEESK